MHYDSEALQGARCAVVGIGVENTPLIQHLCRRGAQVVACDSQTAAALGERYQLLQPLNIQWSLGANYLQPLVAQTFDYVFLTPGLIKDLPEIQAAAARGAHITGQMDLFLDLCPAPVIGITGSSGKSTTTSLIGAILAQAARPSFVGGNIGRVLLAEIDQIEPHHQVVLELSSFQLELVGRSPQLAVLLNIRPNHLDIHGTMAAYTAAKLNIARWQQPDDTLIYCADEAAVAQAVAHLPGRQVAVTTQPRRAARLVQALGDTGGDGPGLQGVATLAAGHVVFHRNRGTEVIMPVDEVPLPGHHNLTNVLAAVAAGRLQGIAAAHIVQAVANFQPLEHRLEPAGQWQGVRFYNDSVATAPDRTVAALAAFTEPVILLAGGYDKHIPYEELGRAIAGRAATMRGVVLIGSTADAIADAILQAMDAAQAQGPPPIPFYKARDLDEAVDQAAAWARPGDVVLFSPASASYDMFPNFIVRGRRFKEAVQQLGQAHSPKADRKNRRTKP